MDLSREKSLSIEKLRAYTQIIDSSEKRHTNNGGRDDDDDAILFLFLLLQPFNISRRPSRSTRRTARRFKSPRFAMSQRRRDDFAVAGSRLARRRHRRDARGRVFFAQRFSRAGCEQGMLGGGAIFRRAIGCFFRSALVKTRAMRERSDLCFLLLLLLRGSSALFQSFNRRIFLSLKTKFRFLCLNLSLCVFVERCDEARTLSLFAHLLYNISFSRAPRRIFYTHRYSTTWAIWTTRYRTR